MEKRIVVSAGVVGVSPAIVLAVYEVMGWKMPTGVAVALITVASIAGLIALVVMFHGIWAWLKPRLKRFSLQAPIYRKGKPNPFQWLLDIAEEQRKNPCTHLVVNDRIWFSFNRNDKRPFLRLRIFYTNYGVNNLVIGQPEGYPFYQSEKLPESISKQRGQYNVPAGGNGNLDLEVYIPSVFLGDVCKELDSSTGEQGSRP